MIDTNSTIAREARALADAHVDQALFQAGVAPKNLTREASSPSGPFFSDLVEHFRRPLAGIDIREGWLIQAAVALALKATPGLAVITNYQTQVTETDLALAMANRHTNLSHVGPPLAGAPVKKFEFDIVFVDVENGRMSLLDVKRSDRDPSGNKKILIAASISARRDLRAANCDYFRSELVVLRWFPVSPMNRDGVVTRETIDEALGVKTRDVVDHAVDHYRAAIDRGLRGLIGQMGLVAEASEAAPPNSETVVDFPRPNRVRADVEALGRRFSRPARRGSV